MPDSTFINRVAIENFKSIADCDVHLTPLTFLVGPNGAGKSNFLDCLSFIKDALLHSLDFAIRQRGGIHSLQHYPRLRHPLTVKLDLTLPSRVRAAYSFTMRANEAPGGGWRWDLLEEKCRVGADYYHLKNGKIEDSSLAPMPAPASDRLFLVLASGHAAFRELFDTLSDMHFHQLQPRDPRHRHLRPSTKVTAERQQSRKHPDGPKVLDRDAHARIQEFLRLVLPTLAKVSVEPVFVESTSGASPQGGTDRNGNRIALVFHQVVGNTLALFGPTQMSEGTLRTLAILTALYQIDENRRPALVAIEDVEAAIHPAELVVLFDALEEASLTTQVIVTSQSPELLDHKNVRAESILAVNAQDGLTRIGPPDVACQTAVDQGQLTVGELLRIGQLAPASSRPAPSPSR